MQVNAGKVRKRHAAAAADGYLYTYEDLRVFPSEVGLLAIYALVRGNLCYLRFKELEKDSSASVASGSTPTLTSTRRTMPKSHRGRALPAQLVHRHAQVSLDILDGLLQG